MNRPAGSDPAMIGGFAHRFVPARAEGAPGCALLMLHGTGGNEDDLIPLGEHLAPGAALLSPRGRVLERGMPRFFRRLAEGVFDLDDLRARTLELAEFVTVAASTYGLDATRIAAVGFSNGANIAASLLLMRPGLLRAAVLFRPMVPFEPDALPELSGTQVFISAGREDPLVPASLTERLSVLLRDAGAEVTLRWEPGGHALTMTDVAAARAWLASVPPCRI
jgi:predicted esterase